VKAAIEAGYQHQDYSQRKVLVQEYYSFLSVMKPGDLIATQVDGVLHVGAVESSAEYVEGDGDRLRRTVNWRGSISDDEIPASVVSVLDRQGSIVDITEALPELKEVFAAGSIDGGVHRTTPGRDEVPKLPPASAKLVHELHVPRAALQEIIDLLASRQQIVLYGPPGTGKTFIAKAIARHIIGSDDRSRMQLVQFHPSYAYEDFFEGYRPDLTPGGEATFSLQEGPLARIAREARENPGSPYVLVIDELNRANLAKVFGELYFLLEYRNESINLQYRPDVAFRLPRNLFIIGTMNTADRSIALLDAAMRRRFSFVELHPDEPPVNAVLDAWLKEGKHSRERARLLEALNSLIEDHDRDLRIGPSYLMRDEADTEEGLTRIWKYDIMPLLEEHYYGRLSRKDIHKRFNLAAIRQLVEGGAFVQPDIVEIDDELFVESQDS
jgi:5-methylcytosine-specific restriction protein B